MRKVFTIARREFAHNLRRPSFLFAVFGTPAIIAIALILGGVISGSGDDLADYQPVGFVDASAGQVLAPGAMPEDYDDVFVRYPESDAAEAAARAGEINAYFVLAEDYLASGIVTLYTMKAPPDDLFDAINALLRENLSVGVPNELAVELVTQGSEIEVTVQDGNRTFDENAAFFVTFLPVIFGFLLILTSVTASTFVMTGLVEEKANRIMEVLITSVRPMELLLGKIIGMGLLGLMQVVLLLVAGIVGISIAQERNLLSGLTIPTDMVLLAVVYYLLAYFLMAAVGIAIGAIAGSEQESRQLSGFFVMPVMIPYVLLVTFIIDPNGNVPVILSLIPFTAPMAILMRVGMTSVPLWQIAFSILGLILLNLLVLSVAAKLFRWGVLSTNKTPGLRRILRILRGHPSEVAPQKPRQPEAA